ncbi:hypothetical protein CEXT_90571 [Caerostris extrusa]|uniref:Uncharacterized protein n=1 Tax=Caerostris extrusa TaxID=172846 RepID=A0AAV4MKW5_CAEEX|nr:hypothetical protein CEXT_90571 [Caerostris extrusa]
MLSTILPKEHIIYRNFGPNNSTNIVKEEEESREKIPINRNKIINPFQMNSKSIEENKAMNYERYKFNETTQQKSNRSNDIRNSLITVKDKKNRASTHQQDNAERIIPTEKIAQKLLLTNIPKENIIYRNFGPDSSSTPSTSTKEIFEIFLHFRDNRKGYKFNETTQQKSNGSNDIRNSLTTKQEEKIPALTDREEIGQKLLSTYVPKDHIIYRNFRPNISTGIVKEKEKSREIFPIKDNRSDIDNLLQMNLESKAKNGAMNYKIKHSPKIFH